MENDFLRSKRVKIMIACLIALILIIVVIVAVVRNYDYQTKIVSVKNYPSELRSEMRENLEMQLRRLLDANYGAEGKVEIEAVVREGTFLQDMNDEVANYSFLVDIDEYQQTYEVVMAWSNVIEVPNGIMISCPETRLMKYPEAECVAMYNTSQDVKNIEDNPIYDDLPISVDEFDYGSRSSLRYDIRAFFNSDNQLVVTIVDYSGGNYENALKKIRELGYNPDDYIMEYVNQAGEVIQGDL